MHTIILEMLLAVVELPQLPQLLLKLRVHTSCAGAAAAVVRHRVPDDAICCCGFLHLIPDFISLYSNTIIFEYTPWQCFLMYSLDSPIILHS